jgi:hypothetical protein
MECYWNTDAEKKEVNSMIWAVAAALAAGTVLIRWLRHNSAKVEWISDLAGLFSFFVLFAIAAESVLETLLHHTVFMTEVHQFLLNPLFLAGGGYLGPYLLALMTEKVWKQEQPGDV